MLMLFAEVADLVQEPNETGVGTEILTNWSSLEWLKTYYLPFLSKLLINVEICEITFLNTINSLSGVL